MIGSPETHDKIRRNHAPALFAHLAGMQSSWILRIKFIILDVVQLRLGLPSKIQAIISVKPFIVGLAVSVSR